MMFLPSCATLLATLAFAPLVWGQGVVLDAGDMPQAGELYQRNQSLPGGLENPANSSGSNVSWNYTSLAEGTATTDSLIEVTDTPFAYQFFFNNPLLYPATLASFAIPAQDISLDTLSVSNGYEYYRADEEGFYRVGYGATINGIPLSVRRQPVDQLLAFPFEYGDMWYSQTAFLADIPPFLSLGTNMTRQVEADAWGTLSLPGGTFECLRVKNVINATDTVYISTLDLGQATPRPEVVRYSWYAPEMGFPVLTIDVTAGAVTSVKYWGDNSVGREEVARPSFKLYPNPAAQEVRIELARFVKFENAVNIYDITGKRVSHRKTEDKANAVTIDVSDMKPGTYMVRITTPTGKSVVEKLVVIR